MLYFIFNIYIISPDLYIDLKNTLEYRMQNQTQTSNAKVHICMFFISLPLNSPDLAKTFPHPFLLSHNVQPFRNQQSFCIYDGLLSFFA